MDKSNTDYCSVKMNMFFPFMYIKTIKLLHYLKKIQKNFFDYI